MAIAVPIDGQEISVAAFGAPVANQLNANTTQLAGLGVWQAYTPVVKFGAVVATITSDSRYVKIGQTVIAHVKFRITSLNGGTGIMGISRPFPGRPFAPNVSQTYMGSYGAASMLHQGVAYHGFCSGNSDDLSDFGVRASTSPASSWTSAAPVAVAAPDEITCLITYESAT